MQELTFDIDVKPPQKEISLKDMRESVIRAREGKKVEEVNRGSDGEPEPDRNCDFAEQICDQEQMNTDSEWQAANAGEMKSIIGDFY